MKLFIDTADVDEIRRAHAMGVLDGVTTNPSLVAKTGRPFEAVIREICEIVDGPVSAECVETEAAKMIEEGRRIAALADNVVVKVPLTADGLVATKALASEGIRTNVTLCFQPVQALLAAKAGATYVSPFVGRLDDISSDGMGLIADIVTIFNNYDFPTEVLVASVRHPMHLVEAARLGADVATVPFKVIEQLVRHPLTEIGLEKFLADHRRATESR
ncbi:MAG: fructose-6-phosphate aldolase [Deltaproteobacteria bacterium]|nr:MAG: fructose-6-phosphate aldolase [Deltaproteobacteria bacterium]